MTGLHGQAAGDNQVEVAQVGCDIQGQAMEGDAPADSHADGADLGKGTLPSVGPDADGAGVLCVRAMPNSANVSMAICSNRCTYPPTDRAWSFNRTIGYATIWPGP